MATGSWSSAGTLAQARYDHAAELLPSGNVLVAGGTNSSSASLSSAEIYDPITNKWSAAAAMSQPRTKFVLTSVASNRILAAGGAATAATEIYDVVSNTWVPAGNMAAIRADATGSTLTSGAPGRVLVAGGTVGASVVASAEYFELLSTGAACSVSGECSTGCCAAGTCAKISSCAVVTDSGVADTGLADTGAPDSGVADTGVADTGVSDSTSADSADATTLDAKGDSANDANDAGLDSLTDAAGDFAPPDDGADAKVDATSVCGSNTDCPATEYCDSERCVPRVTRDELGCGCHVVSARPFDETVGGAAFGFAFASSAWLARRKRRRSRAGTSPS